MKPIRVAIVGLGNCASSLVQGIEYYRHSPSALGLINRTVAGYEVGDIQVVLGIDVDTRKVGKDVTEAVASAPNNTTRFQHEVKPIGAEVIMGRVLDGVSDHMQRDDGRGFQVSDQAEASLADIVAALEKSKADVLVNFLPVGSQLASEFYMECALDAGLAVVNCIPVFIASDARWEDRFRQKGLPIVGDDIKAQIGATIVHRMLSQLFGTRGVSVEHTYQLNTGGNTDFMNMLDRERIGTKKVSKTQAVQSALDVRLADEDIVIGPSEFVPWQKDNKICFLRMEGQQFGGVPMNLEMRLSVEDSPNAAACVVDAIRFCKGALDRGEAGALIGPSAFYCKHPPRQMPEENALQMMESYLAAYSCAAE